jgi:hypothetical protein
MTSDPFAHLPLFASDREIATALVGKARAAKWVEDSFPAIAARSGFPRVDSFHGGRAVPLVRLFYEGYLGMTGVHPGWAPDGEERLGTYKTRKRTDADRGE